MIAPAVRLMPTAILFEFREFRRRRSTLSEWRGCRTEGATRDWP